MEILSTEKLTNERWVNLYVRRYRHLNYEGRWAFASRRQGKPPAATDIDAVVIVPVLLAEDEPRLIMIREYRVPVADYIYAFPAGLAEEGETAVDVARRELAEETGLEVVEVQRVSPPVFSSAGLTDESAVMVFVTARAPVGGRTKHDASEEIEILSLTYQQVCDLCNSSSRIDGKAWVALYMYQMLGRLA